MTRRRKVPTKETEMEAPEPLAKKVVKAIKEKPSKKFKNEPDWMAGDGATVANLFLSIQKSDCNSAKMITELKKLYKKVKAEFMISEFQRLLLFVCFFRWDIMHSRKC